MRLVTFSVNHAIHLGVLHEEQVIDLSEAYAAWRQAKPSEEKSFDKQRNFPDNMLAFLEAGDTAKALAAQILAFVTSQQNSEPFASPKLAYALDEITMLPPIQHPGKIVCLGQNYRSHVAEMNSQIPDYPVLFAKFSTTLIGHRQPIVLPKVSHMVDYEAELALVVGKRGKDIPATEAAFEYLAGYTIFNDVSVRDYQKRTGQWLQGKTFDGSGPIGPAIVTTDEVHHPEAFEITLELNGEVMQHATTTDFIFSIPTILSYLSQIMTLEPGDIIATGTPGGIGAARKPPVFLKSGDIVHIEISELGLLENPVV